MNDKGSAAKNHILYPFLLVLAVLPVAWQANRIKHHVIKKLVSKHMLI